MAGMVSMSVTLRVSLLSGRTADLRTHEAAFVEEVRLQAQEAFGVGRARLTNSAGVFLNEAATVHLCGLRSGDMLALLVGQVRISRTRNSAAAVLGDGSVVTWGEGPHVQLKNVREIQASKGAFAAILCDGSVVVWGKLDLGSNSVLAQHQLKNVKHIQASDAAFAALLDDGSVVIWGVFGRFGAHPFDILVHERNHASTGWVSQRFLRNVRQIQSTTEAFAAILDDGSVVTWGSTRSGGNSHEVEKLLRDVQQIQASSGAFAAILGDGSVVTWGDASCGGDSSAVQARLKGVLQIQACSRAS